MATGRLPGILRLGFTDFAVILALVFVLYQRLDNFAGDPGLGWHLKSGELIVQSFQVPRSDPFLAWQTPKSWQADQWLSSVVLYLLFQAGGWPLLYAVLSVIYLATYFLVLAPFVAASGGSILLAALASFLTCHLGSIHFILRPLIFSFLMFAILVQVLSQTYDSISKGEPRLKLRLILLAPFFALWANLHPYFFLGLALLGMLWLGILCDMSITRRISFNRTCLLKLLALGALCTLSTLLNPYGYHLYEGIFKLGGSKFFTDFLVEWKSISFSSPEGQGLGIVLFILLCGYLNSARPRAHQGFYEFFYLIFFSYFALSSVRGLPLFMILAALPLARALHSFGQVAWFHRFPIMEHFFGLCGKLDRYEKSTGRGRGLVVIAGIWLVSFAALTGRLPYVSKPLGPSKEAYPYQAVAFLSSQYTEGKPYTIANEMNWGGFITWQGYPAMQAVFDDRLTIPEEEHYRRYLKDFKVSGDWRGLLRSLQATHVLVKAKSDLAVYLIHTKALPLLYEDTVAALFEVPPDSHESLSSPF